MRLARLTDSPQKVVDEFLSANDASHYRTGVYTNSEGKLTAAKPGAGDGGLHIQREVDKRGRTGTT